MPSLCLVLSLVMFALFCFPSVEDFFIPTSWMVQFFEGAVPPWRIVYHQGGLWVHHLQTSKEIEWHQRMVQRHTLFHGSGSRSAQGAVKHVAKWYSYLPKAAQKWAVIFNLPSWLSSGANSMFPLRPQWVCSVVDQRLTIWGVVRL